MKSLDNASFVNIAFYFTLNCQLLIFICSYLFCFYLYDLSTFGFAPGDTTHTNKNSAFYDVMTYTHAVRVIDFMYNHRPAKIMRTEPLYVTRINKINNDVPFLWTGTSYTS